MTTWTIPPQPEENTNNKTNVPFSRGRPNIGEEEMPNRSYEAKVWHNRLRTRGRPCNNSCRCQHLKRMRRRESTPKSTCATDPKPQRYTEHIRAVSQAAKTSPITSPAAPVRTVAQRPTHRSIHPIVDDRHCRTLDQGSRRDEAWRVHTET